MNRLETNLQLALSQPDNTQVIQQAYAALISADLLVLVEDALAPTPKVRYLNENGQIYLPVFSQRDAFLAWAQESSHEFSVLKLKGQQLITGLGAYVTLCLNPGSDNYKEFNPQEIQRLKLILYKLQQR